MEKYDKFNVYGKITWLWANSLLHREWPVIQQAHFILPAILETQFLLLEEEGVPVAYCSWAFLDSAAEAEYILNPSQLSSEAWKSGERLWFIDWISPFAARHTWALRSALAEIFPRNVARAFRVRPGENTARIVYFSGSDLPKSRSKEIKRRYFEEMAASLASSPKRGRDFMLAT